MKKVFIITLMLLSGMSFGQTAIKKDNISSGGGSSTIGNTTVIYTVGEVVVQENTIGNVHVSEGFINAGIAHSQGVEKYDELQGVRIYPNPVSNILNIQFDEESNYQIIIADISGKQLLDVNLTGVLRQHIDIQQFDRAIYLLIVKDLVNKKYKVFKLLKK